MQNQQNPLAGQSKYQIQQAEERAQFEKHAMIHPFAELLAARNIEDKTQPTPALLEFTRLVDKAVKIEFNPEWANGTGYFNHAVRGPSAPKDLDYKKIYTFDTTDGRQGLIVPTPAGNVVVFNRYSDRREIIASNMPRTVEIFFMGSRPLTADDLKIIGGSGFGVPIGCAMEGAMAYEERRKKYDNITVGDEAEE